MSRLSALILAATLVALVGCRRSRIEVVPPPTLTSDVGPDASEDVQPRRARRRLPPPLRPPRAHHEREEEDSRACTILVNQVCALLSEGAEECTEARSRITRRPGTVDDQRCTDALDWYRARVDEAPKRRRVRPCTLLAQAKCAVYGKDSTGCAKARADVTHLAKTLDKACRADLLLFKAFR